MATSPAPIYRRAYVWELPVRFYHWVNALCTLVLIVTGFLIGSPANLQYGTEAYQQYWFGIVRFVHFAAAFVFLFNYLPRLYWAFVGNRYARWSTFLPLRAAQRREILHVIKIDLLQLRGPRLETLGHNALASLTYTLLLLVVVFQVATGLALYGGMSDWFLPQLFAGVVPLMGGEMAVRQWHHAAMWFFVVFTIVHVYLVFHHDYVEGRGETSSMIGGWKFVREDAEGKPESGAP